jgi:hypothetical protein
LTSTCSNARGAAAASPKIIAAILADEDSSRGDAQTGRTAENRPAVSVGMWPKPETQRRQSGHLAATPLDSWQSSNPDEQTFKP